jgi:outer membrane murein-binding lipoprotein Lpp
MMENKLLKESLKGSVSRFWQTFKHIKAAESKILRSMTMKISLVIISACSCLVLTSGCSIQQKIASEASQIKTRASSVRDRLLLRKISKKISSGEIASAKEDLEGFILPSYRCRAELLLAKERYKTNAQEALTTALKIEDSIWEIESPSLRSHALLDLIEFFIVVHRDIPKAKQVLQETEKTIFLIRDETLQHRMVALLKLKEKYNHLLIRGPLITQGENE